MKLRNVLLILVAVLVLFKFAIADQESDLIGLGMPAPLASKVADPEDLDVTNNVTIGGTLGVTGTSTLASVTASALTSSSNLTLSTAGGYIISDVATVAPAGSVQGDATPLVQTFNYSGAADNTKGYILPDPGTSTSKIIFINNASAGATVELYPHSGGQINDQATNAGVTMSANSGTLCYANSSTAWNCFEFSETTL